MHKGRVCLHLLLKLSTCKFNVTMASAKSSYFSPVKFETASVDETYFKNPLSSHKNLRANNICLARMPLNYATCTGDTLTGIKLETLHFSPDILSGNKDYLCVNVCASGRSFLNHCKDQSSVSCAVGSEAPLFSVVSSLCG